MADVRKNFPEMEENILKFWEEKKIFEKSIEQREGADDFVFYDGPPFATGLPHHGHILASTSKDMVGRYKTMRGYRVLRRWGWDCHGLPVENICETELGISGRKEIEEFGIDKFNHACETSVLRFDKEWESVVSRIGRFVDFKNSYMTMDKAYIESVWWGFKQLFDKELIYEDTRISLYCPRCETPLSNFEIAMDNSYQTVKDPSIYVKFKKKDTDNEFFLIWTTTPWTLPGNSAIAVHPKLDYVKVELDGGKEFLYMVREAYERLSEDLPNSRVVDEVLGADLLGQKYEPVFGYFEPTKENTYTVVAGEFVSTTDGTGIVHIAPSFGDDDYQLGKSMDLDFFETVDGESRFIPQIKDWMGQRVWDVNEDVIEHLKGKSAIVKVEEIEHQYPFCWRCETKLIYKTQPAWFVAVKKIKQRMIELNEQIKWHPEHLKEGRFGNGLETAPDWNISRSRYWGNPIPVWKCSHCPNVEVFESVGALSIRSGKDIADLHRPNIDEVTWACECEGGNGVMRRTPEVFDCWFESGSMPWASVHYPFENKDFFETTYPAEFISEYIAQTRGWFYTLHVLATGIFDKPSFVHAVTTGTILAADGKKISKSKKNFTPPQELFDMYGVDSMRYYLMASQLMNAENLNYKDEEQADVFRKIIMLTWNVYTFFDMYREHLTSKEPQAPIHTLDKWILAKLNLLVKEVTEYYDAYDITRGTRLIGDFINELSTWYIRRSRDRYKNEDDAEDRAAAVNTTYQVLLTLSKVMAPITPFIAEELHKNLEGEKESVHLEEWPEIMTELIDTKIIEDMESTRGLIEKALAVRAKEGVKIRQALGKLYINKISLPEEYLPLIADEVNVKEVIQEKDLPAESESVKINADENYKVALDLTMTEELRLEGNLRELTRHVNAHRKELGLTPQDIVTMFYATQDEEIKKLFTEFRDEIAAQTKAKEIKEERPEGMEGKELKVNGLSAWIGIVRL